MPLMACAMLPAVAVAHHQNDQAETVLLNLRRSPGLRGLQGMRPKAYTMSETIPVRIRLYNRVHHPSPFYQP